MTRSLTEILHGDRQIQPAPDDPALCATLNGLAVETWELMSFGLARTDVREPDERTFTDHHFLHLARSHGPEVCMWLFTGSDEALTGADVEWWVGDGTTYLRMLVQAKRLDRKARYSEAGRDIGKTGVRQIDRLLEICATGVSLPGGTRYVGFTPAYLFYNGDLAGTTSAGDRCCTPQRAAHRGCTVAPATAVRARLDSGKRPRRWIARDELAPFALPWSCLFCCPKRAEDPARRVAEVLRAASSKAPSPQIRMGSETDEPDRRDLDAAVRTWKRAELPFDPTDAPEDTPSLLRRADGGWRPGGRLLVVTTLPVRTPAENSSA